MLTKNFQIYFTDTWKEGLDYVQKASMSVMYKGCKMGCKNWGVQKWGIIVLS